MIKNDDFAAGSRINRATARAASTAKGGIDAGSAGADRALNAAFSTLDYARNNAAPAIAQGIDQARDWVDEKAARVQDGVKAARDKADDLTGQVVDYLRDEPVKALLIAAAVGAGLVGLFALLARSDD